MCCSAPREGTRAPTAWLGWSLDAGLGKPGSSLACWVPEQVRRAWECPVPLLAWPKFLPSKITLPGISPRQFRMGEEPLNDA